MLMGMMIVVGFIVGFLVGCTGMGGIILIPALVYLSGLSSHVAMGTTLFTFIFTTSLCSWLYIRLGHVDWKATIPICIGGVLFSLFLIKISQPPGLLSNSDSVFCLKKKKPTMKACRSNAITNNIYTYKSTSGL